MNLDIDLALSTPVAFTSLRRVLEAISAVAPRVAERARADFPEAWNHLFPGSVAGAPDLNDVALSPSERRLHRESEQVFRVLTMAARAIMEAAREAGRPVRVRNAGAADLVSLRGLVRAVEWGRLQGDAPVVVFEDWAARSTFHSRLFEERRDAFLAHVRHRLRLPNASSGGAERLRRRPETAWNDEGRYLGICLEEDHSPERRIAAAILAVRSCFFSTNYEGAMLAAEIGLALVDSAEASLSTAKVTQAWDELDTGLVTAAIEVGRDELGGPDELRALLFRCVGVVWSFCGQNESSMEVFGRGLQLQISPERKGQLRMFRALSLIKRMNQLGEAHAEGQAGVDGMKGRSSPDQALHEAWLRNVLALTWFMRKNLDAALEEELKAIHCLSGLHTPSATHLKINLITNLSVIQQSAKQFDKSIATWRKFEKTIDKWDTNFHKHHRYRLAALHFFAKEPTEGIRWYKASYESAGRLKDAFNEQVIAADMGVWALERNDREEAAAWFERSIRHAATFGDPQRIAEGQAGLALATGGSMEEARRHAQMSSTFEREAAALIGAIDAKDQEAILRTLPRPRSKLNRPFDLVNLY